jgi:hypothetical protein
MKILFQLYHVLGLAQSVICQSRKALFLKRLGWVGVGWLIAFQVQAQPYPAFRYGPMTGYQPKVSSPTQQDMAAIRGQQRALDPAARAEIRYWNAAYPSYRWHQIMMAVSDAHEGHKNGGRVVIMHLAVYDALAAVWSYKQQHPQTAPCEQSADLTCLSQPRPYSSFICEYSAAAGAAHAVIQHYFPARAAHLDSLLGQFLKARLATGLQSPADLERGLEIGRQMAGQYLAYAQTDGTNRTWSGNVPDDPTLWSGTPTIPMIP